MNTIDTQQDSPIMPGAWVCDKCKFILQKNTFHTKDGSDSSPLNNQCPNDGQLMRPLTWATLTFCMKNKDQTKRMEEIVRLKKAIQKTDVAIERAEETLSALWEKKSRQRSEYFTQNLLLKWNLP